MKKIRLTEKFLEENITLTSNALPGQLKQNCLRYSKNLKQIIENDETQYSEFEMKLNDKLVKKGLLNDNLCLTVEGYHFFN